MARKLCTICQLRPVGYGTNGDQALALSMGYCTPCLTEAEWENEHSDYAHADGEGYQADVDRMAECWECHPELNEAQKPYAPRQRRQPAEQAARRTQLNHKSQCTHPQTPAARRACREEYWAAQS